MPVCVVCVHFYNYACACMSIFEDRFELASSRFGTFKVLFKRPDLVLKYCLENRRSEYIISTRAITSIEVCVFVGQPCLSLISRSLLLYLISFQSLSFQLACMHLHLSFLCLGQILSNYFVWNHAAAKIYSAFL